MKMTTNYNPPGARIRRACALLLAAVCAGTTPACDDRSAFMDASADADDSDRSTKALLLQCQTATVQGGVKWTYTMAWFELNSYHSDMRITVSNDKPGFKPVWVWLVSASVDDPDPDYMVWIDRAEEEGDGDEDGKRLQVSLTKKSDGNWSIDVDHMSMGWQARGANGWCKTRLSDTSA